MIDLHCHSQYSDGILSVEDLYQKALDNHISLLALTDHDTVAGVGKLMALAQNGPVKIIPAIELSVRWKTKDIHIVGLNIDMGSDALTHLIAEQKQQRLIRAQTIAEKLERLGIERVWDKVCKIAGHEHIARPHFAKLLVDEGKVKDLQKAFTQFLGRGRQAFVPTIWSSVSEAVSTIRVAGGLPVIAHPLKYTLTNTKLHELIRTFKEAGGVGIEVVSGETSPQDILNIAKISLQHQLLASTGSDFHGGQYSRVDLGKQRSLPDICEPIWTAF